MSKKVLILHDGSFDHNHPTRENRVVRHLLLDPPTELGHSWAEIRILLGDAYHLQGLRAFLQFCGTTGKLTIRVESKVLNTVLHAPTGLIDGRAVTGVRRTETDDATELSVTVSQDTLAWIILATCVARGAEANHPLNSIRIGVTQEVDRAWFGFNSNALLSSFSSQKIDLESPGPTPFFDVELSSAASDGYGIDSGSGSHGLDPSQVAHAFIREPRDYWYSPTGDTLTNYTPLPPFDQRLFNPIGIVRQPSEDLAYVHAHGEFGLAITDGSGRLLGSSNGVLHTQLVTKLRPYRALVDLGSAHQGPRARAMFLLLALASGIPIIATDTVRTLQGYLPPGLLRLIREDGVGLVDPTVREAQIFTQVRGAHRSLSEVISKISGGSNLTGDPRSVSVVIPTKRPDYVRYAVLNFLAQSWHQKELLLGFHGFAYDDLDQQTQALVSEHSRYVEFAKDTVFGDVLRGLTLAADGRMIAKMDDDDWYSDYHIEDLVYALSYSDAQVVGSSVQFIYLHNSEMTVRRGDSPGFRYGGHPGGPTMVAPKSVVLDAGNWPRVQRAVDTGLYHAILRLGGSSFISHPHNFLFNRRASGHTWKATDEYFLQRADETWPELRKPTGFTADRTDRYYRSPKTPDLQALLGALGRDQDQHYLGAADDL